jgi:hypothetical protein
MKTKAAVVDKVRSCSPEVGFLFSYGKEQLHGSFEIKTLELDENLRDDEVHISFGGPSYED